MPSPTARADHTRLLRPPVPVADDLVVADCLRWLGRVLPLLAAQPSAVEALAGVGRVAGTVLGPEHAAAARMMAVDATWADRGANRCFVGEGGVVPPPPRSVLDPSGDRLRCDLDPLVVAAVDRWLRRPEVAAGLVGVHAFSAGYAEALTLRRASTDDVAVCVDGST